MRAALSAGASGFKTMIMAVCDFPGLGGTADTKKPAGNGGLA
jgi:hypothetical protein